MTQTSKLFYGLTMDTETSQRRMQKMQPSQDSEGSPPKPVKAKTFTATGSKKVLVKRVSPVPHKIVRCPQSQTHYM